MIAPLAEIFVFALAENVEVFLLFHVIVSLSVTGLPLANVEMLILAVLIEPLLVPPVTPPPLQPLTGRTTLIVCAVSVAVRPGVMVIVPLGFAQTVPPAAPAGPAVITAIGANSAMAIVNTQILLMRKPLSWSLVAASRLRFVTSQ